MSTHRRFVQLLRCYYYIELSFIALWDNRRRNDVSHPLIVIFPFFLSRSSGGLGNRRSRVFSLEFISPSPNSPICGGYHTCNHSMSPTSSEVFKPRSRLTLRQGPFFPDIIPFPIPSPSTQPIISFPPCHQHYIFTKCPTIAKFNH